MRIGVLLFLATSLFGQGIYGSRTIYGNWDASNSPVTIPFTSGIASNIPAQCTIGQMYFALDGINGRQLQKCTATDTWNPVGYDQGTVIPLTCGLGQLFFKEDATAGQNLYMCTSTNVFTQQLNSGGSVNKAPGCTFDGGGATIAVNSICYSRIRVACTLSTSYQIIAVGTNPTATIDVLKIATGTTLPTSTIISSSTPAISTGNMVVANTVLTGSTISIDDVFAFKVTAVTNATWLDISLKCN